MIKVCAGFGTAIVVVGLVLAFVEDSALSTTGSNDYLCSEQNQNESIPGGMWLLWALLLVAVIVAVDAMKRMTRSDRLSKRLTLTGIVAAVVLFPGWLMMATAFNCGL